MSIVRKEHLPGLRLARDDTRVMIRMIDRGEGMAHWRTGLVMFGNWLDEQVTEAEALPTDAERPDTPALEPPQPEAPGDSP